MTVLACSSFQQATAHIHTGSESLLEIDYIIHRAMGALVFNLKFSGVPSVAKAVTVQLILVQVCRTY